MKVDDRVRFRPGCLMVIAIIVDKLCPEGDVGTVVGSFLTKAGQSVDVRFDQYGFIRNLPSTELEVVT